MMNWSSKRERTKEKSSIALNLILSCLWLLLIQIWLFADDYCFSLSILFRSNTKNGAEITDAYADVNDGDDDDTVKKFPIRHQGEEQIK